MINIVSHALALSKEKVLVDLDREVDEKRAIYIRSLVNDRARGKPLAYITNQKEFFSEPFFVDEHVLVPRPETEALVEEALEIIGGRPGTPRVIDMGTGSGAIGIMLSKRARCSVVLVDVSPAALGVAKKNAGMLGVRNGAGFVCSDLFGGIKEGGRFDMVLANLPYVSRAEWDALPVDVKAFEPRGALHGGEDGMEVYRRLVPMLPRYLKEHGHVLCEIGSEAQSRAMQYMMEPLGFEVTVKRDLSGKERVIIGTWKNLL